MDEDGEEETNRDCLRLARVKVDFRSFEWTRRQNASEEDQSRSQKDEEEDVNGKAEKKYTICVEILHEIKNDSHSFLFV